MVVTPAAGLCDRDPAAATGLRIRGRTSLTRSWWTTADLPATRNVVATAPLPAGVDFVSASGSGVQPDFQSGVVTAAFGTLLLGQTATVTIVVRPSIAAPAPGLVLAGSVVGDAFDPVTSDNSASVSVPVDPSVDLGVQPLRRSRPVASRASRSRSPPRSGIPGPRRQRVSPSSSRSVRRPGSSRRPEPARRNYRRGPCSPISAHYRPARRHL